MKPPLFVRALTKEEKQQLKAGLRSDDAFTLRRSQILLANARGQHAMQIARNLGCASQTVRNTIRDFEQRGLDCLKKQSCRPKSAHREIDTDKALQLKELLHQSPRTFGKECSTWTLELVAKVCAQQGLTQRVLSRETIRQALSRLGINWKRAKHWITSPDPQYECKKNDGID